MNKAERILVLCAHDDDEVIGAGGTIRQLANTGAEVTTVIFATGNEGYLHLSQKESIVARRREERQQAQKILGTAHCISWDFPDFSNLDCESVYHKIMSAVRSVRPHLVFTHQSGDYLAHRTLARIAPEAIWQAGWQCSLELGSPWQVDRIYHFPILEMLPKPSHIIDITDTFEAKLEAMRAYASQHEVVAGILDQIEARARAWGAMAGIRYGEAFMRSQFIPLTVANARDLLKTRS